MGLTFHRTMHHQAADLLQRRVLSVAAFAREENGSVAAPNKEQRLRLYGSTLMPIPVALLPGESEAQYEHSLEEWLAASGKPGLRSYQDVPNQERSVRILFAKNRVKEFSAGGLQHPMTRREELEVPSGVDQQTAWLYTKQFVDIDQYRREVKAGKFTKLAAMSQAERTELFGSPIVPISVPLAKGETPQEYEERFLEWLRREHRLSLQLLRSKLKNKTAERFYRLQFAKASAFGKERFVPAAVGQKRHREVVLRDDDDGPFFKKPSSSSVRTLPEERPIYKVSKEPATPKPREVPSSHATCRLQTLPRKQLFHEIIAAYALCACKKCLLNGIQMMTSRLAGVGEDCEREGASENTSVQAHCETLINQAEQTTRGPIDSAPPCSDPSNIFQTDIIRDGHHTSSRLSEDETLLGTALAGVGFMDRSSECHGDDSKAFFDNEAHQLHGLEISVNMETPAEPKVIVAAADDPYLATNEPQVGQISEVPGRSDFDSDLDPMEDHLLSEYETSNQAIAMKEAVLNDGAFRLNDEPPASLEELTQLHDQNQAIRSQLELETAKRGKALGRLITYMWRDNVPELQDILRDSTACDMAPVQRAVHQRCLSLAKEIAARREEIKSTKERLDAVLCGDGLASGVVVDLLATIQPLGDALAKAEQELKELTGRRRREITTLLRFDKRLRSNVQHLLDAQRA